MSPDPGVDKAGLCQAGGEGWIPAFPGRTKKAGIKRRGQERDGTVSNLAPCRLFQQPLGNPRCRRGLRIMSFRNHNAPAALASLLTSTTSRGSSELFPLCRSAFSISGSPVIPFSPSDQFIWLTIFIRSSPNCPSASWIWPPCPPSMSGPRSAKPLTSGSPHCWCFPGEIFRSTPPWMDGAATRFSIPSKRSMGPTPCVACGAP